jgi:hypothetical protein
VTCAAAGQFEIIFDAVGGQAVEDGARMAFEGRKGHFVTIIGPGADTFGEGTDGGFKNIANGISISARYQSHKTKNKNKELTNFFVFYRVSDPDLDWIQWIRIRIHPYSESGSGYRRTK